ARYATNARRVENRADITALLAEIFQARTTREWVEALEAAGVPNGPINDIRQVFEEPQVIARGMKLDLPHPTAGRCSLVASPMRFSATPLEYGAAPPTLGQHTEEVLCGMLGLTDAQLAELRASKAI
ncbi:MAG TPA: CoA transferase, partial [Burkholderiales bacterium]|nr:CoA transferase [Burkholderiales bacterium]